MTDSNPPLHHPLLDQEDQVLEVNELSIRSPHKCFFCFSDMRVSVITVRFVWGIFFASAWLISYSTGYFRHQPVDPDVMEDLERVYSKVAILLGVGMLISIITISGALWYSAELVLLSAVYSIIERILSTYYIYPVVRDAGVTYTGWYIEVPVLITIFVLYLHVV